MIEQKKNYDFKRLNSRRGAISCGGVGLAPITLTFASHPHSTPVSTY